MLTIKRYPNRKLYNTEAKQYITLDGVAELIRQGAEIRVVDHATGADLTALTLTQIILEREKNKSGLLSHSALIDLIRAGGDRLTALQRSLFSSISIWQQLFNREIERRIHALIRQGDLSDEEAESLLDKLTQPSFRQTEATELQNPSPTVSDEQIEALLRTHDIPTRDDLNHLVAQLEELTLKVEELTLSRS